jgi:hypothetical protein
MHLTRDGLCFSTGDGMTCYDWGTTAVLGTVALAAVALALVPLLVGGRRTATPTQAAGRAARHATAGSAAGALLLVVVLLAFAAATLLTNSTAGRDGRVLAALPAVAGLCLAVAHAVAQVTWPRPTGARREADLARRGFGDVLPARGVRLLLAWTVGLAVALPAFVLRADGPRSVTGTGGGGGAELGPYPGSYYATPLGVAVAVLVLATGLTLQLVVLRPAVAGVSPAWDLHLRRRSARHLVAGAQLALAASLAAVLALAGTTHRAAGDALLGVTLLAGSAAVTAVSLAAPLPRARPLSARTTPVLP